VGIKSWWSWLRMQKDEWVALVIGGGGFIWAYTTQYQQNNLFFGYPSTMWLILPIVIAVLYLKRKDLMGAAGGQRRALEQPNVLIDRLKSDEGQGFREKFDIFTFTDYSKSVQLFKGNVYRVIIKDSVNGERYLAMAAEQGFPNPFLSVYKYGDWNKGSNFTSEKDYLNQLLPKDKPTVLDVMDELPEGEKGSALQYFKGEVEKT
jgi:hypothetical protein